jgi:hypothetical protein
MTPRPGTGSFARPAGRSGGAPQHRAAARVANVVVLNLVRKNGTAMTVLGTTGRQ